MVSPLLGWHPSGTEPIGVACKALGWQGPEAIWVPVQTTPPSWPLAVASAAKLTAPVIREAVRRPAMIALLAVPRGRPAPVGVITVTPLLLVWDFFAKVFGSYALLMSSSFFIAAQYLFKQVSMP